MKIFFICQNRRRIRADFFCFLMIIQCLIIVSHPIIADAELDYPTYITNHMGARTLIRKLDRDELLQVLVKKYLGQ